MWSNLTIFFLGGIFGVFFAFSILYVIEYFKDRKARKFLKRQNELRFAVKSNPYLNKGEAIMYTDKDCVIVKNLGDN